MGLCLSVDPLLGDIYNDFEEKHEFESIFPLDPSQPNAKNTSNVFFGQHSITPFLKDKDDENAHNQTHYISDSEIDVNKNSANLSDSSPPLDVLIDLNQKASKLIIRLTKYNGSALRPIINLGLNENKNTPQRSKQSQKSNEKENDNENDLILSSKDRGGLILLEVILSYFIRSCSLNVGQLCLQKFFPNDIKSMIISFYSSKHPKLLSFGVIVPSANLCKFTLNLCNYIGSMLGKKLLFDAFIEEDAKNVILNEEHILNDENAFVCCQLIFLFHYVLCLDQYKMPNQQYLTNNFTAYKRMHSQFSNSSNFGGGGFGSFNQQNKAKNNENFLEQLSKNELLPIDEITNIAMFMGRGSTACIDTICDSMQCKDENMQNLILSYFANGCLFLLRANGQNKANRNMKVVKYSLFILRAMTAILLILDTKKSAKNQMDSVFGGNENIVKNVECVRMICSQFMQSYGDDASIKEMQQINAKEDIEYHIKYCKRIIKFGAKGFKNGQVKRSIQNMFD